MVPNKARALNLRTQRRPLGWVAVGLLVALSYFIVAGGTDVGELNPWLRILNAVIAGALLLAYAVNAHGSFDRVDRRVLLAVTLFTAAGVLSQFARQSFDAVLGALTFAAGLYAGRRALAADHVRTVFVRVLIGLSAVMTLWTASRWLPQVLEWMSLTNWETFPPLTILLPGSPWGDRHDLALLVAMLYPSWWVGASGRLQRACAIGIGAVALSIVILDGSRLLWLALLVATACVVIVHLRSHRSRFDRRVGLYGLTGLLVVLTMVVLSGSGAALAQRLSSFASLESRAAIWGSVLNAWLAAPIAGFGPGSFPWILQRTDFFDMSSFAPRHPDSAIVQLLGEGGLVGVAALLLLVSALTLPILRSQSTGAQWALIAFAVAALASNPSDFAFLVVLAIAWAAYAMPHGSGPAIDRPRTLRPVTIASLACLGVIGVAYAMTLVAAVHYDQARMSVAMRNLDRARPSLDAAVALDPGMALYVRQRGALHHLLGETELAIHDLQRATTLNPSDDLAWRSLALVLDAAGDRQAADAALLEALRTQRSDATNLLLTARLHAENGRMDEAAEILAEVVQAWPAILAAPGWAELLGPSATAPIIDAAVSRWQRHARMPEVETDQGIWLAILGDREDLLDSAESRSDLGPRFAEALVRLIGCDRTGSELLENASEGERRRYTYWQLRLGASIQAGELDETAAKVIQVMSGRPFFPDLAFETLHPFNENGYWSGDRWGYRRMPIVWPAGEDQLPSPQAGAVRWLLYPWDAVRAADLEVRIPQCAAAGQWSVDTSRASP